MVNQATLLKNTLHLAAWLQSQLHLQGVCATPAGHDVLLGASQEATTLPYMLSLVSSAGCMESESEGQTRIEAVRC